ncbi:MAG: phage tail tape measure protein [Bifidobacteriaceae bacterium]|jgi:TP901 family phage tail tape measure protein|nr:phage tail tape measure protein [Bifidobacteriaceae bacterium]
MASTVKDLVLNILANDKTGDTLGKVGGKADEVNKKVAAGAAAVGAAVLAGAGMAVNAAMDVDGAMDIIQQGTGATGDGLESLRQSFETISANVPTDFEAVANTVGDLNTRLGLTGPTLDTLAEQVLRVGGFAGQSEVDIANLSGAFNLFGVPAAQMSKSMDLLYGVSQATGVSVNDLTGTLTKNGAQMTQLGFSFAESAQLLGTLDKAGLDATKMTSLMGTGLAKLAKDNEDPQDAFRRTVTEIGELIAVGDQAAAINLAGGIFGTKGASQFVTAVQSGSLNLETLTGDADAAGRSILDMAESTDDFPEKWEKFQNKLQLALAELGEKLLPVIEKAFEKLEPAINWFADNIDLVGKIGAVIGIVAGAVLVITGAMKAYAAVQAIQTASQLASNAAWLTSPVTWIVLGIVAAVAALIAIGTLVVKNWDDIAAWFKGLWEDISGFFAGIWEGIKSGISGFIDWCADIFFNWTPLGLIIKNWDAITEFFGNFWDGVVGAIDTAKDWIGDKIEAIVGFFTSIPERIGDAFSSIGDGLKSAVHGIASGIAWLWNHSIGAIEFTIPDWVPLIGGKHFDVPDISVPALAAGGIVTAPTLALLGESGPEAVVPLSRGGVGGYGGRLVADVPIVLALDGAVLWRGLQRVQVRQAF